jgi:hypothetical protein
MTPRHTLCQANNFDLCWRESSEMQPMIRTFLLADLKCYMCGATAGSIERERGSTTAQVAIERGGSVGLIGSWETSRLRCPRCGGSVYVDQVEIVDRRTEPMEWEDDGPRRGRPPKWLVEQRRRKRDSGAISNR